MNGESKLSERTLDVTFGAFAQARASRRSALQAEEVGRVTFVGQGIARLEGLPGVGWQELVHFSGGVLGMAFNLTPREVGVILLDESEAVSAGAEAKRTHQTLDVSVGEALLSRVVDGVGRPQDGQGPIRAAGRLPIERPAPAIMDRAPVTHPLQTGIKVVDALIPVGRGQRELILGDRQTGKTALAVDTIINQRDKDVLCVYCAIGQRRSSVARVVAEFKQFGAMEYCVVVATSEEDPPGLQFVAPYAAMSIAEYFMEKGRDVLVVLDDLTRHARAYRELSLLLRRPPGREAFPGDVFYIHSRLLERSTHLSDELGGGSVTALPIVETEAQNMSAYIPTNLISITDGQIYLSPELFQRGILPAVDVGKSVSRVGGKTQLAAYRRVAADLRLSYSQFEELEAFARFGTRLDTQTKRQLVRGRRVREIFKQSEHALMQVAEQIAVLAAAGAGVFDEVPVSRVADAERAIAESVLRGLPEPCGRIESGEPLDDNLLEQILHAAEQAAAPFKQEGDA